MDTLKNRLLFGNMIGLFVLAYALMAGPGLAAPGPAPALAPLGSAFTYEGRISATLSGGYDFRFRLFNAASGGSIVTTAIALAGNVTVRNGEYLAAVNFGPTVGANFTGEARYLEISYRTHSTDANAPYTLLPGKRPQLLPVPYAMSLRPGAEIKGSSGTAAAMLTATNMGTGIGVWGRSANNAALYGESTNSTGVVGQGAVAGVLGRSTGGRGVVGTSTTGNGVSGTSTSASGVVGDSQTGIGVSGKSTSAKGVYGETAASGGAVAGVYGKSTGAGSIGVLGEVTGSGNSWGVYGIGQSGAGVVGKASSGVGVSGISTLGYAMESYGHATQRINSGGWVKAMALVRADGVVEQCFNSQIAGVVASFSPCGITVTKYEHAQGSYALDFGFSLANRFVSVTPFTNPGDDSITANLTAVDDTSVGVWTFWSHRPWDSDFTDRADAQFFIIIY